VMSPFSFLSPFSFPKGPPEPPPRVSPPRAEVRPSPEDRSIISDEFVRYVQSGSNPHGLGLRADGRFYPYSTPAGRRIGHRQPVADKSWYGRGLSKEEAGRQLRENLERAAAELRERLTRHWPQKPWAGLSQKIREILVDFAHSEGVAGVRPELYRAVLAEDWKAMVESCLYVRMEGCRPDSVRNRAFAQRWINREGQKP